MKIGELARATGTGVETVRFYEKSGLLPPPARTGSNYRSYGSDHLQRLSFVRRARALGFSLDDVRALLALADNREQPCEAVDAIASAELDMVDRKIADLSRMRDELARIVGACRHGTVSECRIIETLGPRESGLAIPHH
jgi:Cu(I)-responsive transcriptional regulator